MEVKLDKISLEEKQRLMNIFQLYMYEITRYLPMKLDDKGLYHYDYFDNYWTDPTYEPFFIKVDGEVAGFVLINEHFHILKSGKNISEFFILQEYKRRKVGSIAAKMAFDLYKGPWEVRPVPKSDEAHIFWTKVINEYTNGHYNVEHTDREVITFNSK